MTDIKRHSFETIIGTVVLFIAFSFVIKIYKSGNVKSVSNKGIVLNAKFTNVDGIEVGTDVKIGGVKIGSVLDKKIDKKTFRAILSLAINEDMKIPTDSNAIISSSGLLGGKYVEIKPGIDDEFLKHEETIIYTQSSMNLEELIGKFALGNNSDKK